jgi:hypothetical protein
MAVSSCPRWRFIIVAEHLSLDLLSELGLVEIHRHMNISTLGPTLWMRWMSGELDSIKQDTPKTLGELEEKEGVLERLFYARRLRNLLRRTVACTRYNAENIPELPEAFLLDDLRNLILESDFIGEPDRGDPDPTNNDQPEDFKLIYRMLKYICDLNMAPNNHGSSAIFEAAVHLYLFHRCWFMQKVQQPIEDSRGLNRMVRVYQDDPSRETVIEDNTSTRIIQAYRTGRVFWLEGRWNVKKAMIRLNNLKETIWRRCHDIEETDLWSLLSKQREFESEIGVEAKEMLHPKREKSLPGIGCILHFVKKGTCSSLTYRRLIKI